MTGTSKPRRRWAFTRREFHVASAISLLLCIGLLMLDDASRSRAWREWMPPFVTRIVFNAPEWIAEENRIDAALAEAQEAHSLEQSRLRNLPGAGTANETEAALDRAELQFQSDRERIFNESNVVRRPYVMPIRGLTLISAILPLAWALRWLAMRPHIRREAIRPAGIISCTFVLITVAMFVATLRSYFVGAAWEPPPVQIRKGVLRDRPELVWGQFPQIELNNGRVIYFHYRGWFLPGNADSSFRYRRGNYVSLFHQFMAAKTSQDHAGKLPGLEYVYEGYDYTLSEKSVAELYINVSCWLLILVWLVLTLPWWRYFLRRLRSAYRRQEGRCATCGYSAVGNSTGICSECGSKLEAAAKGGKNTVSVVNSI